MTIAIVAWRYMILLGLMLQSMPGPHHRLIVVGIEGLLLGLLIHCGPGLAIQWMVALLRAA